MPQQKETNPDAVNYEQSVFQAGLHSARPPFTFQSNLWEPLAKETLSASSWGYIQGNAGAGSTYQKNLAAFDRYSIVPSRRNELFSDTSTTVLGETLPFPIAMAPIGVQKIFNEAGETASAKAAQALGTSMEDVATANGEGGKRWYQMYFPSREHDDITISLLDRAKAAILCSSFPTGKNKTGLTDAQHPDRIGVEIGLTDPVFRAHFKQKHGYDLDDAQPHHASATGLSGLGEAAQEWTKIVFPGHPHTWEDIAFLRAHWAGPIVLKGVQSVADAEAAVAAGVQGIVVSNHGGRQQDGGVSSLGVLPRIVSAVGGQLDVFFDSGVRCGADVIKALALGAKCVLVGRPYAYGLALGGEDGVRHVLRALCGDLVMNMHLAGLRGLDEVTRDILVKEDDLF
ncbi:FMN-dependent dehydrogenase [Mycena leptocephala]|nr:FMN-dependent dehydrogenase [Mycena leptocephala]